MVRITDHETRRNEVLASIINNYFKTATPVASEALSQEFNCSPATIRHVMAELEEIGLVTHPYTSAGRIPTDKGYRYYVDRLMNKISLLEEERNSIDSLYQGQDYGKKLEYLLDLTSQAISDLTRCAGIVSFLEWRDRVFYRGTAFILQQPEFKNVDRLRHLFSVLEDRQRLLNIINRKLEESIEICIGNELLCDEMRDCSLVITSYGAKNQPVGRIAVLGPKRMDYSHVVTTLEYVSDAISDILSEELI